MSEQGPGVHSKFIACAKRGTAGEMPGPLIPHPHAENFQPNSLKTQLLFSAPAKRMKAQLHSVIMLMYLSAIVSGILLWLQ